MIEARDLTKRYGEKLAVDHLSFTVEAGRVTGFLGPNGAGKSTTMRLILGLDHPQSGTATIDGRRYADLAQPLRTVGALLEARSMHPGRSAYNHLLFLAQTQGLPRSRVDQVLDLVGLGEVARKRTGGYSLGMGQRVGIAVALLGDPQVLMLDEPVNGLDPEGILWIRNLMKQLAAEGRTVFVSSHLMNEMAVTADHLIVIGRGKLIADCSTQEFIERSSEKYVLVRSPDAARLADLVAAEGGKATIREQPARDDHAREAPAREAPAQDAPAGDEPAGDADGARAARRPAPEVDITGLDAPRIGEIAAANRIVLHELTPQLASLEEAYMELTADSSEFGTGRASASPQPAAASPGTPPGGGSPGGHSPGDPARVAAAQERTE
ncbi:MAG TPA: ABC transporter ATP-binding protein [Streptosporangiaceae bacterium]